MAANPQEEGTASEHHGALSLDQVLSDIGVGPFHNRLLLICGLGFTAVAFEVVLLAFLIPELRVHWILDEYQLGLLVTSSGIASVIGSLTWGVLADRFGRRPCFVATVVFVAVFGGLAAVSQDLLSIICFRAAAGFGLGGSTSVDFTLYSEFFPTKERGTWLFRLQVFWPMGQLMACLAAWYVIPQCGWRIFLVVCAVPSLLSAFVRPLVPESPRWLLLRGRVAQATEVCRHMAIMNGINPEAVGLGPDAILSDPSNIATPLRGSTQHAKGPLPLAASLFSPPLLFTTIGIIIFSTALHTVSYGNLTLMPSLLQLKGVAKMDTYPIMVCTTLAELPGVLLMMFLSKHIGRLVPMKITLLAVGLTFLAFGAAQGRVPIILTICCGSFFAEACWGCFHVYVPEAYPTELRATAVGWLTSVGSMAASGVPMFAAFLLENFSLSTVCAFFATCAVVGSIGSYLFLHIETFERHLQDRVRQRCEFEVLPDGGKC